MAHLETMSSGHGNKFKSMSAGISFCLSCGKQLTYCGVPFSADVACVYCGVFHRFNNAQQPSGVIQAGRFVPAAELTRNHVTTV